MGRLFLLIFDKATTVAILRRYFHTESWFASNPWALKWAEGAGWLLKYSMSFCDIKWYMCELAHTERPGPSGLSLNNFRCCAGSIAKAFGGHILRRNGLNQIFVFLIWLSIELIYWPICHAPTCASGVCLNIAWIWYSHRYIYICLWTSDRRSPPPPPMVSPPAPPKPRGGGVLPSSFPPSFFFPFFLLSLLPFSFLSLLSPSLPFFLSSFPPSFEAMSAEHHHHRGEEMLRNIIAIK